MLKQRRLKRLFTGRTWANDAQHLSDKQRAIVCASKARFLFDVHREIRNFGRWTCVVDIGGKRGTAINRKTRRAIHLLAAAGLIEMRRGVKNKIEARYLRVWRPIRRRRGIGL